MIRRGDTVRLPNKFLVTVEAVGLVNYPEYGVNNEVWAVWDTESNGKCGAPVSELKLWYGPVMNVRHWMKQPPRDRESSFTDKVDTHD